MKIEKVIIGILLIAGAGALAWSVSNALSRRGATNEISPERYAQMKADETEDKCATPPEYTDEAWQTHMSHHPDQYSECFDDAGPLIIIRDIAPADLATVLDNQDIVLIDTHIPEQERIPGTDAFIPYNEIEQSLAKLPKDKNAPIVVYCRSGNMSTQATKIMMDMGYTNVYNLAGGTKAWAAAGYSLEEITL